MVFYKVNHRYRPKIIVPYIEIIHNIDFLTSNDSLYVLTADNVKCNVIERKEVYYTDILDTIKEIYGIDYKQFIEKWQKVYGNNITTDWLVLIELNKIE